jgi:hypothetical protein
LSVYIVCKKAKVGPEHWSGFTLTERPILMNRQVTNLQKQVMLYNDLMIKTKRKNQINVSIKWAKLNTL